MGVLWDKKTYLKGTAIYVPSKPLNGTILVVSLWKVWIDVHLDVWWPKA